MSLRFFGFRFILAFHLLIFSYVREVIFITVLFVCASIIFIWLFFIGVIGFSARLAFRISLFLKVLS